MTAPSITTERPAHKPGSRLKITRARRLYAVARTIELSPRSDEPCKETARQIALLALDLLAESRAPV